MNHPNSILRNNNGQLTPSVSNPADGDHGGIVTPPRLDRENFIGKDELIKQHQQQLIQFEKWNTERDWLAFHHHHYDWWMFPIDEISSRGKTYQLPANVIDELRRNHEFIADLRRGVRLMVRSWGWNIDDNQSFAKDELDKKQEWSYWPVRLYKAGRCMWLFNQLDYYESLKDYAHLIKNEKQEKLDFFSHTKGGKIDVLEAWDLMEQHRSLASSSK